MNLINNAYDAMPGGGQISIKTMVDGSHVLITFEDTGLGMPDSVVDNIFDPFFTTKGTQATGLGMSVSYGIITKHKGTITVDSVEGEGTTFTIILSKTDMPFPEEEEKRVPVQQKSARILVIEDEQDVRELLCDILIDEGHDVQVAVNGQDGIKVFQEKTFDLVLSDLGLPGMTGWQVAREIKKIDDTTPIALITGWHVEHNTPEMKENGVDLLLNKPFKVDQILRLVQEGLEIRNDFG